MNRRTFLRAVGGLGVAGLLAGCEPTGESAAPETAPSPSPTGPTFDPVGRVAPEAEEALSVITGSFEQLTGTHPIAFGIVGPDNEPLAGAEVEAWLVPVEGGEPSGPFPTTYNEVPGNPLGIYVAAEVEIADAGPTSVVAVTADGQAGAATMQVTSPEESALPAPGDEAIDVATPTTADQMGMAELCTAEPDCGMHEISLDTALAEGRPIMLTFATPAYCQTAVCGPSVEVLDQVRQEGDWGDTAFIHVEIFSDEGETVADAVSEWELPSEPWLFAIDGDGIIQARSDGPLLTLPDQVAAIAERLTAG